MHWLELKRADIEGSTCRIRADRIDVIDEIEEQDHVEWQRQVDRIGDRLHRQYQGSTTIRVAEVQLMIEQQTREVTANYPMLRITQVFVQGRRNPWRVKDSIEEVERKLLAWNHGWDPGRRSGEGDEDDEGT